MFDFLDLSGFWELAKERPFTAWCLAWGVWPLVYLITYVVGLPFNFAYRVWNRWLRHRNIMSHGWPTAANMDADGDIVHPKVEKDAA